MAALTLDTKRSEANEEFVSSRGGVMRTMLSCSSSPLGGVLDADSAVDRGDEADETGKI